MEQTVYTNGASENNSTGFEYPHAAIICCALSCALSIVGSFIIFGSYAAIPEIRNVTRKLIVCLTVADFLSASGYAVGLLQVLYHEDHTICIVQSCVTTYSSLVSFFLTMATMLHLWTTVVSQKDFEANERLVLCILICFSIPGMIVSAAYSEHALGETDKKGTGPWCWINSSHAHQVAWQVVAGKGWEIMCYLASVSFFILLKYHLHLNHRHNRFQAIHTSLRDEDKNFLYVWLIFYCIRIWGTIRFLIIAIDDKQSNEFYMEVFLYMQSFGDPLQAFCNCILFCLLDKTVRSRVCHCCATFGAPYGELVNSNEQSAPVRHN